MVEKQQRFQNLVHLFLKLTLDVGYRYSTDYFTANDFDVNLSI